MKNFCAFLTVIAILALIAFFLGNPFSDTHKKYYISCTAGTFDSTGKCSTAPYMFVISWRADEGKNEVKIKDNNGFPYILKNCAIMDSENWNCGHLEFNHRSIIPDDAPYEGSYYCDDGVCDFGGTMSRETNMHNLKEIPRIAYVWHTLHEN